MVKLFERAALEGWVYDHWVFRDPIVKIGVVDAKNSRCLSTTPNLDVHHPQPTRNSINRSNSASSLMELSEDVFGFGFVETSVLILLFVTVPAELS